MPTIDINGKAIETNDNGYLLSLQDWSEEVGSALAAKEGLSLNDKHWDVINYLREEYINNNSHQPNDRSIIKAMTDKWGGKISQKDLYDLFPGKPDKQASRIGGLPETRRKGGY